MNRKRLIVASAASLALLGGGGTAWHWRRHQIASQAHGTEAPQVDTAKYLTIDKIVVMLARTDSNPDNDPGSRYALLNLTLSTTSQNEASTRAQLPRVRGVVVNAMSRYTYGKARRTSIADLNRYLNQALRQDYARAKQVRPFACATVTQYLVE